MKYALALLVLAALPSQAMSQGFSLGQRDSMSVELGLGATLRPAYPGADDQEVAPWLIWRNVSGASTSGMDRQGFSLSPSFRTIGGRDAGDDDSLIGMTDINRAYELGLRANYGLGPVTAYGSVRKGFDGHEGLAGEIGVRYRTDVTERLTLWSGLEVGYGDSDFGNTYFGVTAAESAASGNAEYAPGGGVTSAAAKFEARYAITDSTALMGEVQYGRLIGDASDSPLVQDRDQPLVRLGIVRKFSFGF